VQVRRDGEPRALLEWWPARGRADEAGDLDEPLIDLLVERRGGRPRRQEDDERGAGARAVSVAVVRVVLMRAPCASAEPTQTMLAVFPSEVAEMAPWTA